MVRAVVKLTNSLISIAVVLALLLAGAYAAYCLWDNQQIYAAADAVQAELSALKPAVESAETAPTFDELVSINPDVRAWITMDETRIDHPVLQGGSNMDYINTDVYGNFALAGSIFLDCRNAPDFSDPYSVLYGHHMEKGAMFGDLDKYLEADFFRTNTTGELLVPGKRYALKVFACLQTKASDERVFEPKTWAEDVGGLLAFAEKESIHADAEMLKALRESADADKTIRVLALTTCASEFTDARTVVLTAMCEDMQEEGDDTPS